MLPVHRWPIGALVHDAPRACANPARGLRRHDDKLSHLMSALATKQQQCDSLQATVDDARHACTQLHAALEEEAGQRQQLAVELERARYGLEEARRGQLGMRLLRVELAAGKQALADAEQEQRRLHHEVDVLRAELAAQQQHQERSMVLERPQATDEPPETSCWVCCEPSDSKGGCPAAQPHDAAQRSPDAGSAEQLQRLRLDVHRLQLQLDATEALRSADAAAAQQQLSMLRAQLAAAERRAMEAEAAATAAAAAAMAGAGCQGVPADSGTPPGAPPALPLAVPVPASTPQHCHGRPWQPATSDSG